MSKTVLWAVGVLVLVLAGAGYWYFSEKASYGIDAGMDPKPNNPGLWSNGLSTSTVSASTTPTAISSNSNQKIMHATLHTSMGDITVELFPQKAPNTVANFIKLASSGFYSGTKFHRVIKGFMDQGGDPLTKDDSKAALWGTGGPGYKFNDEIAPENGNVAGALAMANSGPNTQGSQFFINAVDNRANLGNNYTVFGQVTSGMDVVVAINNTPTGPGDRPLTPVVLNSVTVSQ